MRSSPTANVIPFPSRQPNAKAPQRRLYGAGDERANTMIERERRLARRAAALDELLGSGQNGKPGKSAREYVDLHNPLFAAIADAEPAHDEQDLPANRA